MKLVLIKTNDVPSIVELPKKHSYLDLKRLIEIESPITCVTRKIGKHYYDIWCDDEGLYKEDKEIAGFFVGGREILCGHILVAKHNSEGETTGLTKKELEEVLNETVSNETLKKGIILKNDKGIIALDYEGWGPVFMNTKGYILKYDI